MSHLQVLVVDENANMRSVIKTLLKSLGVHELRDCSDAADAFEELRTSKTDIVIVDLAMHNIDGVEFTQLVRTAKDSPNRYVPIIMLTAHTERARVEAARDAGITEFLRKPVCAADLYARIVEVIERPRNYVRSKSFFGPDRRRREDEVFDGDDRRGSEPDKAAGDAQPEATAAEPEQEAAAAEAS
ncbi:MAG: response regulator [Hyphomicrobiales bacterium]